MPHQQKLHPLQVPWRLSTYSGDTGELSCREYQQSVRLTFAGHILANPEEFPHKIFTVTKSSLDCEFEHTWQIVGTTLTLTFGEPAWIRMHPLPFDRDVQAYFNFDLSDIPYDLRPGVPQDIDEWQELNRKRDCECLSSGMCPMSYAFEVSHSVWLAETMALLELMKVKSRPLHHYLFQTYEVFYEMIAADLVWTSQEWEFDEDVD